MIEIATFRCDWSKRAIDIEAGKMSKPLNYTQIPPSKWEVQRKRWKLTHKLEGKPGVDFWLWRSKHFDQKNELGLFNYK